VRDREHLLSLTPKSKVDMASLPILEDLEMPELTSIAKELLEWTKDSNWPVAEPICNLLVRLDDVLLPFIRAILVSGDNEWVWHLVNPLLSRLTLTTQSLLLPDLLEYLTVEHERDYDDIIEDFLERFLEVKYGITTQEESYPKAAQADVLTEISYLRNEHGGKSNPIETGYRPQFYYDNQDWDANHEYLDAEWVFPGDRVKARVSFLSPDEHLGKLNAGDHFLIREGQKIFGYGHVVQILDLEISAIRIARWKFRNQKKYKS